MIFRPFRWFVVLAALVAIPAGAVVTVDYDETLAGLVPENPVFFLTVQDFESLWSEIETSNFWRQFTGLRIWDELRAGEGINAFRTELADKIGVDVSRENIMALIGREVAFALYVEKPDEDGAIKADFLVLMRGNPLDRVEEIVEAVRARVEEAGAGEAIFSAVVHDGVRIESLKPKEETEGPVEIRYAFVGDVFVLGMGNVSPRIEAVVDSGSGRGKTLAQADRFMAVMNAVGQERGQFLSAAFVDLGRLREALGEMSTGDPDIDRLLDLIQTGFGQTDLIGRTTNIDRGLRSRVALVPVWDEASALQELRRQAVPREGRHRQYLPVGTVLYVGHNHLVDADRAWSLLKAHWEQSAAQALLLEMISEFEKNFEVSFDQDVVSLIGREVAFLVTDVDTRRGFPFPQMAVMLEVKDRSKAVALIERVVETIKAGMPGATELPLVFEEETYEGIALHVLPTPSPLEGEPLRPTYAFLGDFLVVASDRECIKTMIDVQKGRQQGLSSSEAFVALAVPAQVNGVVYVNWDRALQIASEMSRWAIAFAEARGQGEAVRQTVEDYVKPILQCLRVVRSLGGYSLQTQDMTVWEATLQTRDFSAY